MSEEQAVSGPLPVVNWLKGANTDDPFIEGHKCGECGAVFLGERSTCSACSARNKISTVRLSTKGKLYSYCIVHRSFPGIEVPYISAIVDLEGGGTIKGNLINIEPDPEKIEFDMSVEVVFQDALGRKDKDGNNYLSYFFQPAA